MLKTTNLEIVDSVSLNPPMGEDYPSGTTWAISRGYTPADALPVTIPVSTMGLSFSLPQAWSRPS